MNKWYSVENEKGLACCRCGAFFEKGALILDHHPSICPNCNVECLLYDWEKGIQIVTEDAPYEMQHFIRWAQKELDELEFLELLVGFEEIAKKLYKV